jgi:hypothetical protein
MLLCMALTGSDGDSEVAYSLRISRLTIDKLGVKLYDRVSAVVAELIANCHDADASNAWVELPLSTVLATTESSTGEPLDKGYQIIVRDDGHGMTPREAQDFFLKVGSDRRKNPRQGDRSRRKDRPVMGRKGIGKLAPFGICTRIEVVSSGGNEVEGRGFLTSHFFLDFSQIVVDSEEDVPLDKGQLDGAYRAESGTQIILTSFLAKRVPSPEDFHRQLGVRFAFVDPGFQIHVTDTRPDPPESQDVAQFRVDVHEETRIDVSERPLLSPDGRLLPVTGWLAMAKQSHKHDEGAGVRIYARGKIVATSRDFEQPAGFTGEYTMRSYLVGQIAADWLDAREDLIRTDRQSILWDSDLGSAFRTWGAGLIREVARLSTRARRQTNRDRFMDKARIKERASDRYKDDAVADEAIRLGETIGEFTAGDELSDDDYIDDLTEIILSVAPHQALVEAFKEIAGKQEASIDELVNLFGKTKLAEMASYAQVAAERVTSIHLLEQKIAKGEEGEDSYQALIANAPWLIRPDWSVLTANQPLKTFRNSLQSYLRQNYNLDVDIAVSYERKRPDFTLIHHGNKLRIIEIKVPRHQFDDQDFSRLANYVEAFEDFFEKNKSMAQLFPDSWQIDLIADGVNLREQVNRFAFRSFEEKKLVVRSTWQDFLLAASQAHEQILNIYMEAHEEEYAE